MFTPMLAKTSVLDKLFIFPITTQEYAPEVTPQDLSCEIDDIELASEMFAQLHNASSNQTLPEVNPDEFDAVYSWFLS